jgi:hypothetical protein
MLIGILSDTHDRVGRTVRAVEALRAAGAEVLIHCGDITTPEIVYACSEVPAYFVLGNNDFDIDALERAMDGTSSRCLSWGGEIELAGKRLAVTHGHLVHEYRRLLKRSPDYLFLGHSHDRADFRNGPTRCINPGALHRAEDYSVAVLDLDSDRVTFIAIAR